ncbi:MAG TPA: FAD-binding oxidoreductase, partial [Hyphomicrobiaceae bacterium]|nr:FAD-binding oxidoreductase [Hyphomicrobiaceae bacterium]
GRALVHGHCHRKALGGIQADIALLEAAGLDVHAPDTGCCGMAGAFGFRRETYEASVRIADLALLPRVRVASPATLIVADGFSCREQIEDLTGRVTLHLAEVLARSLPRGASSLPLAK